MSQQLVVSTSTVKKVMMTDLEKWLNDNKINLKLNILKRLCECKRMIDVSRVVCFSQERCNYSISTYEDKILPRSLFSEDSDFLMEVALHSLESLTSTEVELVEKFCEDYIEDKFEYPYIYH